MRAHVPGRIQELAAHSLCGSFLMVAASSVKISSPFDLSPASGGWTGMVSLSRT